MDLALDESTQLTDAVKALKAHLDVISRDLHPKLTGVMNKAAEDEVRRGIERWEKLQGHFKGPPAFRPEADGSPANTTPLRLGKDSPEAGTYRPSASQPPQSGGMNVHGVLRFA